MLPSFIGFSFFLVVHVHAQTSYSSVPSTLWNALSSDKSGTYLTATSDYEGTFYSTDSGNTWASSIAGNFESIASNTNSGQYVIAASTSGTYVSSNFGASFEESTTTGGLQNCVSVSGTGEYMVSVSQFESTSQCLSYSSDFGLSFTKNLGPSAAVGECVAVALNDAGTTAVVSVSGSGLWMSSNPTSSTSWIQVYPSANTVYDVTYGGANFYAGLKSSPYSILLSSNNGNTWITRGSIGYSVSDIAVDSTGTKIVVAAAGMYYSDNSGLTFYTLDNTAIHSSTCAMNGAADNALWAGNSNVFHADPSGNFFVDNLYLLVTRVFNFLASVYARSRGSADCATQRLTNSRSNETHRFTHGSTHSAPKQRPDCTPLHAAYTRTHRDSGELAYRPVLLRRVVLHLRGRRVLRNERVLCVERSLFFDQYVYRYSRRIQCQHIVLHRLGMQCALIHVC